MGLRLKSGPQKLEWVSGGGGGGLQCRYITELQGIALSVLPLLEVSALNRKVVEYGIGGAPGVAARNAKGLRSRGLGESGVASPSSSLVVIVKHCSLCGP